MLSSRLKASRPAFLIAAGVGFAVADDVASGVLVPVADVVGVLVAAGVAFEPSSGSSLAMRFQMVAASDVHCTRLWSGG